MYKRQVYICGYDIAGFGVGNPCIFTNDFFNDCSTHMYCTSCKLVQSITVAHGLDQSTGIDDLYQIFRKRSDGEGLTVVMDTGVDSDFDGIAFFYRIMEIRILDQEKSIVDGIAEKDAGKGFCDCLLYTSRCV